jgi:hypothetical protein
MTKGLMLRVLTQKECKAIDVALEALSRHPEFPDFEESADVSVNLLNKHRQQKKRADMRIKLKNLLKE